MTAVYLFGAILAILIVAVVAAPFVERRGQRVRPEGGGPTSEDRREAALDALRELEFEFQTGKLTREDYLPLRAKYAAEAIAARDELGEGADTGPGRCPTCGAERRGEAKFCSRCGTRLAAEDG